MRIFSGIGLALLVGLVGCGGSSLPPPVPVSGKVTFNGDPVEGAVVTFHSAEGGTSASGRTESDGSFQLTTINTNDGARPGEYSISIAKTESKGEGEMMEVGPDGQPVYGDAYGAAMDAAAKGGDMSSIFKNQLPEKYASAAESGLTRTVIKGEPNEFNFEL